MNVNNRSIRPILFYTVLACLLFPYLVHEIYANDLWKSLYFGRYVAQVGMFPSHAEFAFTPTVTPVPSDVYSWLGHLTLFGIYRLGSVEGLVLFRVLLVIGSLLLIHSLAGFRANLFVFVLLLFWGIGLTQKTLVRTAIFVVPAVTLFWWCLAHGRRDQRWIWLGLPVLFAFWSNLHGSYLYGVGLIGLIAIGEWVDSRRSLAAVFKFTWRQWVGLLGVVVLVVTFFKPYPDFKLYGTLKYTLFLPVEMARYVAGPGGGVSAVLDGLRTMVYQGGQYEGEMRSIAGRSFSLGYFYVPYVFVSIVLGVGVVGYLIPSRRRCFSLLLPVVGTVVMGGMYLRFVGLIPLTVVPVLLLSYRVEEPPIHTDNRMYRWLAVFLVGLMGFMPWLYVVEETMDDYMRNNQFHVGLSKSGIFSEAMPAYILNNYPDQPIFTHYDIGGYLIWKWWPEKKVFIDSKNWAYERSFRNDYLRSSPPEMMKRYDMDLAVLPLTSAWNYYLFIPSPNWQLLKYDQGMALYRKGPNRSSEGRLLLTKAEQRALDREGRARLRGFQRFLNRHESNEKQVGIFTGYED